MNTAMYQWITVAEPVFPDASDALGYEQAANAVTCVQTHEYPNGPVCAFGMQYFPNSGNGKQDVAGWYDSDGPIFNCAWYGANTDRCDWYGNYYANFGYTANQACLSCGGGV